jgi:hypothetical protein
MKLNLMKNFMPSTATAGAAANILALALLAASGAAFADGGTIVGISVTPNAVFANEPVSLKVNVTAGFGVHCSMRWMVLDANKVQVKGGTPKIQKDANSAEYSTSFALTQPGIYTVQAQSGPPDSQTVSCEGQMGATLTIKDKAALNPNPGLTVSPPAGPRPAGVPAVAQPSAAVLQVTTLTAIKQVPNTGNSGETWIEAQGTGNCSFSIESAGVPAQNFASSAAKPFPVKVRIMGAPLGSHQWKAKGTGNCAGAGSATFSVN